MMATKKKSKKRTARRAVKTVVVRDNRSGVWHGVLKAHDPEAKTAVLTKARRAHYWQSGGDCSGLATHGPSGARSRISPEVAEVYLHDVVEVLSATAEAAEVWREFDVWCPR